MPLAIALLLVAALAAGLVLRRAAPPRPPDRLRDMAEDVSRAAGRLGFRHRADMHPVEALDDPQIAIAATGEAFLALDTLPTEEQRRALLSALETTLETLPDAARDLALLGRWFVTRCGSEESAITRLARKLYKMEGPTHFEPLMSVLRAVSAVGSQPLSRRQKAALDDIARAFRVT